MHYPLCDRRALAGLAGQPELDHAARLDARACRGSTSRTCACSISILREEDPKALRAAALAVRDLLDELGLPSFVKTSGSKGFHIVIPLDGEGDVRDGRGASRTAPARCWSSATPTLLTQEFIKADRGGRIFVDTGRNAARRDVRRGLRRPAQAGRAGVGALHLGGD